MNMDFPGTSQFAIGGGLVFLLIGLVALVALAVPVIVGVLVYRDARAQDMDPPILWALVAALVPSFIGIIIYFVVRSTRRR